jgi:hypothetical protein
MVRLVSYGSLTWYNSFTVTVFDKIGEEHLTDRSFRSLSLAILTTFNHKIHGDSKILQVEHVPLRTLTKVYSVVQGVQRTLFYHGVRHCKS